MLGKIQRRGIDRRRAKLDPHLALEAKRRAEQYIAHADTDITDGRRVAWEIECGLPDRDTAPFGALQACLDFGRREDITVVVEQLVDRQGVVGTSEEKMGRLETK